MLINKRYFEWQHVIILSALISFCIECFQVLFVLNGLKMFLVTIDIFVHGWSFCYCFFVFLLFF